MVNQTGHTDHGDVIQPARDSNHYGDRITNNNYHGPMSNPDDQSDEGSAESGAGSGAVAAAGGGGFGLLIVIGLLVYLFGGSEPFPAQSDPWPAGVERAAVIAAAGSWFQKCQKSESVNPVNCPQSLDETSNKASKVHWTFYGSYLEAPVIQYSEEDKRFNMLGTVVVSADYTVSKAARRIVTTMKFWAKVNFVDGQLEVQGIKEHSAVGDPEVIKVEPRQPWEPVAAKLENEFNRCVRSAKASMPAGCPDWQPPKDAKKVKWSLTEDPLLTARASFDSKFGIFRVKGTYGIKVDYTSRGSMRSEVRSTNYEALVTTSEAGPVVLHIKDSV